MGATIAGTQACIEIGPLFWDGGRYAIRDGLFEREAHEVPRIGFGYTPMLRSFSDSVERGDTDNASHPLSRTIDVLEILDDAQRQISGNP